MSHCPLNAKFYRYVQAWLLIWPTYVAAICLVGWALRSRGPGHNSKYRPDHTSAALGGWAHLNLTCCVRWVCDVLLCITTQCNLQLHNILLKSDKSAKVRFVYKNIFKPVQFLLDCACLWGDLIFKILGRISVALLLIFSIMHKDLLLYWLQ